MVLFEILTKIAVEATLISTALAGVKRVTRFDIPRSLANRIKHPTTKNAATKYLDLGEWCWAKGEMAVKNLRQKPEDSEIKKISEDSASKKKSDDSDKKGF